MPILKRQFDSSVLSDDGQPMPGKMISHRAQRMPLLVSLIGLLMLAVAISVTWFVNRSMQHLTRQSLDSTLAANTTLLEMWLTKVRRDAARQLESDSVAQAARNLLHQHSNSSSWSINALESNVDFQSLEHQSLEHQSLGETNERSLLGWALLDPNGTVVASNHLTLIGSSLPMRCSNWQRERQRFHARSSCRSRSKTNRFIV